MLQKFVNIPSLDDSVALKMLTAVHNNILVNRQMTYTFQSKKKKHSLWSFYINFSLFWHIQMEQSYHATKLK